MPSVQEDIIYCYNWRCNYCVLPQYSCIIIKVLAKIWPGLLK